MEGAIHSTKVEKQRLNVKQNKQEASKFYYHFLYKAFIVGIFLVIFPLFPSQAPEFINQSLLTKNWELLHLLFVGIAISYGLFSRPNDETHKDNNSKFDNAHVVVSRFLQVSSFFEDEAEPLSESESDETRVQTWSVEYHRNKPKVVVAPRHSNFEPQNATSLIIGEKPLLLPVRSLKSRASSDPVSSLTSKSGSQRFSVSRNSNKARNEGEVEGFGSSKVEDKVKKDTVLPSPIPWRSSFSMDQETEFNKVESQTMMKSQKSRSYRPKGVSSPAPSSSSEPLAKNAEDLMKKKGFYKSSFSPPPPPPPPPIFHKSISMKPRSVSFNKEASFEKELKRSFTSERYDLKRRNMGGVDSEIQMKSKGHVENLSMRTYRRREESKEEGKLEEGKQHFMEEATRKSSGYKHASVSEEEKESIFYKIIVESDEESETEDEEVVGRTIQKHGGESTAFGENSNIDTPSTSNGDEGVDVDKQADEFIAKFREQIRLQRIESIKTSARIATRNSSK
ncbi:hypothetical protein VNO77_41122 [Canavalia gladiata]|uniref:Uncharacterized protein n=1 Tax=Canavalia gladiata TaxID=3824 RepID=A0AAN9K0G2_CANGL